MWGGGGGAQSVETQCETEIMERKVWSAKCEAQSVGVQSMGAHSMMAQSIGRKVWGCIMGKTFLVCD